MREILLIAGPSAVGKSYLGEALFRKYLERFEHAQIFTTRSPRSKEAAADRVFVTQHEFQQMLASNVFIAWGRLAGNLYGLPREDFEKDSPTCLVCNIWPALYEQFIGQEHITCVGLQVRLKDLPMLEKRMQQRGDSQETIQKRLVRIKRDMVDLEAYSSVMNDNGKVFYIHDDKTIPGEVIPWIEVRYNLRAIADQEMRR